MEMHVYKIKDGVEVDFWEEVDFSKDCIVCAIVKGETNNECETKAIDQGYGDSDIYGFTYSNDDEIEISDDVERF